jgi:1-deoxy-D-xylulose-5-phosphate synthase
VAPKPTFTQVFGQWLCDMAEQDKRLVGITPPCAKAPAWSSLNSVFPKRYFDVGIAEQHAVTFAAGLAAEGLKPVVAIYSTFLQRAYDQLIHDVAIQNLPVVFALDRAGLVGADGATHAGAYDIAYLRCIPNISVACPADENECRQLLSTAFAQDHSVAVRYPRGAGAGVALQSGLEALPFGKGEIRRKGGKWYCHTGVWHPAVSGAGGRAGTGCHGGQHALGQAAGYRCCCRWPAATGLWSRGRGRPHGRRRQCRGWKPGCMRGEHCRFCSWVCPMQFIEHGDPARLLAMQGLDGAGMQASIAAGFANLLAPVARAA